MSAHLRSFIDSFNLSLATVIMFNYYADFHWKVNALALHCLKCLNVVLICANAHTQTHAQTHTSMAECVLIQLHAGMYVCEFLLSECIFIKIVMTTRNWAALWLLQISAICCEIQLKLTHIHPQIRALQYVKAFVWSPLDKCDCYIFLQN